LEYVLAGGAEWRPVRVPGRTVRPFCRPSRFPLRQQAVRVNTGSPTGSRAHSLRAPIAASSRCLSSSPVGTPRTQLRHRHVRATRSGDEEGPAHGSVAVGARRWVGRSESSLSQFERGKTGVGSNSLLTWMGTVLQVEVEELTDAEGVTARRDNACTSRRRRSSGP
jgi:hypothetical protein